MATTHTLLNLSGRRAIVTGGAAGIGYGISYRLAEAGAKVLIADISETYLSKAHAHFQSAGLKMDSIIADVSQETDIHKILDAASERLGGLDILVNNAGIYPMKPLIKMQQADFDQVLSINLRAAILLTKGAAKVMIKQSKGGKIINITSIDALHPSSIGLAHYDASKHGLWGFTKNAALELATYNIQVNAVAPGAIATPGTGAKEGNRIAEEVSKAFLSKIPLGRMGVPDDIGKVVLFLASDMASYMTGTQVVVDGGVLLS